MEGKKRPGYLTQYASHAGISKQAAGEQLKRVGIDYMQAFDFGEADRKREAMRHADRAPFAKPIYGDGNHMPADWDGGDQGAGGSKSPAFAEIQARREHYRAEIARLDFEERIGKLTETEKVEEEAFRIGRLVRDAILNVPSRLAGILAAESDQRKVHDLLEAELRQALESLSIDAIGSPAVA